MRGAQDRRGLTRIHEGLDACLYMSNLDFLRDRGHARYYVEMQWRMLQQEQPKDFVIATGRQESVRRFIELTAEQLGWGAMRWQGSGLEETGIRSDTCEVMVRIDPRYFRPAEVETLLGRPHQGPREAWLDAHHHPGRTGGRDGGPRTRRREKRGLPQAQGLPGGGLDGKSAHQPRGDRGGAPEGMTEEVRLRVGAVYAYYG